MKRVFLPILVLAAGILGGTATSVLLADQGALVLFGPLLLALAIVAMGLIWRRSGSGGPTTVRSSLLLALVCLAASLLAWWRDPELVALMVAILGGGAAPLLSRPATCEAGREDAATGA